MQKEAELETDNTKDLNITQETNSSTTIPLTTTLLAYPLSLVTSLNLEGNRSLPWKQVLRLSVVVPLLKYLCLNQCQLGKIYFPKSTNYPSKFQEMEEYFLENDLDNDTEVPPPSTTQTTHLQNTTQLPQSPQNITQPPKNPQFVPTNLFEHLEHLSINNSGDKWWSDFDQLNRLKVLKHLQCSCGGGGSGGGVGGCGSESSVGGSVVGAGSSSSSGDKSSRSRSEWSLEVIARIGALVCLNRSEIGKDMRRSCEIEYLKKCARQMGGRQADASFHQQHPRFSSLVHTYDLPSHDELDSAHMKRLQSGIISVHLLLVLCHQDDTERVIKTRTKKLPRTMTVGRLKMVARKAFAKDIAAIRPQPPLRLPQQPQLQQQAQLQQPQQQLYNPQQLLIDLQLNHHQQLQQNQPLPPPQQQPQPPPQSTFKACHIDGASNDNDDISLSYSSNKAQGYNAYNTTNTANHDLTDNSKPRANSDTVANKGVKKYIEPGSKLEVVFEDVFKEVNWYSVSDSDTVYVRVRG